mmetsp:Transcript_60062/g.172408  ORF Transcript_60062/g.172408 Transcript_60062/m.172408 type:complete len:227 (-) Transcript_60062:215-895(-)
MLMGWLNSATCCFGTSISTCSRYSGLCHGTMTVFLEPGGRRSAAKGNMNFRLRLSTSRIPSSPHCTSSGSSSQRESSPRACRRMRSSSSTREPLANSEAAMSCICMCIKACPLSPCGDALPCSRPKALQISAASLTCGGPTSMYFHLSTPTAGASTALPPPSAPRAPGNLPLEALRPTGAWVMRKLRATAEWSSQLASNSHCSRGALRATALRCRSEGSTPRASRY